jgi:tRNA(Met) C34 N-acetyltransferase TmcA
VADTQETPQGTAIRFSQAYFGLDPAMASLLCSATLGEEQTAVDLYLQKIEDQARSRGYDPSRLKSALYGVVTHTLSRTEKEARIKITAEKRNAINPVFAYVAKLFALTGAEKLEATVDLVKQDGKWKVCGQPFDLSRT